MHAVMHQEHRADWRCVFGEPHGLGWLAAAHFRRKWIAIDEEALVDQRLDDARDGGPVDADMPGKFGAAGGAQIEQYLKNASSIGEADRRGGDQALRPAPGPRGLIEQFVDRREAAPFALGRRPSVGHHRYRSRSFSTFAGLSNLGRTNRPCSWRGLAPRRLPGESHGARWPLCLTI